VTWPELRAPLGAADLAVPARLPRCIASINVISPSQDVGLYLVGQVPCIQEVGNPRHAGRGEAAGGARIHVVTLRHSKTLRERA
jgi:hypothetical protein